MKCRPALNTVAVPALALIVMSLGAVDRARGDDAGALEFFEKSVRPVLAERCQTCHGGSKQKGGLRLDSRTSVLQGGETGPAIVPGKPDESLLIGAVKYADDLQMPPKSRLAPAEVAALTRWVEMGAPWPGGSLESTPGNKITASKTFDLGQRRASHWAWRAIEATTPPEVHDSSWPADPIDRYLLARLESQGLKPAGDADRRVLIRRLTFDLTGLPPTPAEVDAFQDDREEGAEARVVDRLLASPRFGERWGRHWLDLVRYAESRGHEFDATIPNAWHYRDYVIHAFNADLPYRQFVTEQIAGDLLQEPRIDRETGANESLIGTGFWFLGEEVHSPVDIRQDEADRLDNRIDVFSKAFLGLTVACARCHDHKFDAISQSDYYALSGFLVSSGYRQARFETIDRERQAAESLQRLRDNARRRLLPIAARAARSRLDRLTVELENARSDSHHPLHASLVGRTGNDPVANERPGARLIVDFGKLDALDRRQDGYAFGLRPVRPGDLDLSGDGSTLRIDLVPLATARRDPAFRSLNLAKGTQQDHGQLGSWNRSGQTLRTPEFSIGSGRLWYLVKGPGHAYAAVNQHLLVAGPLHGALLRDWPDTGKTWRWIAHDLTAYPGHRTHIEFTPNGANDLEIARVVESDHEPEPIVIPSVAPRGSIQALATETLDRMEGDNLDESHASIAAWIFRQVDRINPSEGPEARAAILAEAERLRQAERSAEDRLEPASTTTPAMADGSGVNEHLHIRGSAKTPGAEVPRRFLEAIAGPRPLLESSTAEEPGSGRLALAEEVVGPSNVFASRVIVNRVWHHLFGRGIVASVDNFGVLGERPSHPELLDHLADRFVRDGWSIKRLIRTIVLTRAYRMSSRPDPLTDAADPENRLLHRMSVRRLEAEPIRDAILAVSGRLNERIGGSSVPVHLTAFMEGRGRPGTSGPIDGEGRRSLYLSTRRNFLSPMMLAFDAPIPFSSVGRRNVSNVPAQALILMNDPFVIGQARLWADHVLESEGTPPGRVEAMYRTAFARPATPEERTDALEFVKTQGVEYGLAEGALTSDPRPWADLAHVLLNAKEFVFID